MARALVIDPKIVRFDELTTGQDPIRRNAILGMIAEYKKKFGFTASELAEFTQKPIGRFQCGLNTKGPANLN